MVLATLLLLNACGTPQDREPSLIPVPAETKLFSGNFTLEPDTRITWSGGVGAAVSAETLASVLRPATGYALPTSEGTDGDIIVALETGMEWKSEEYRLKVERKTVMLTAGTSEGLFRGIQTVRQLLPPEIFGRTAATDVRWIIPCIPVTDYPRFP